MADLNITQEQYDADIRAAKAHALRAVEDELDAHFKRLETWDAYEASQIIASLADEMEGK